MDTTCQSPLLLRYRETREYRLAPCGCWGCPACARRQATQWRAVLNWADSQTGAPQYFITLTLRQALPLWRQAPPAQRAAQRAEAVALTRLLSRALNRLVGEIRRTYGPFEYVAFVELTTGRRTPGHRPHLHLLVRGKPVPRKWLSRRWEFHTHGSFRCAEAALPGQGRQIPGGLHGRARQEGAATTPERVAGATGALQPGLLSAPGPADSGRADTGVGRADRAGAEPWRVGMGGTGTAPLVLAVA